MDDMLLAKVKAILTGDALKLYCHIYLHSCPKQEFSAVSLVLS